MTITEITFGKTYNTGNYTSKRIDVTARLQEGDTASGVSAKLENLCDALIDPRKIERAYQIIANQDQYTGNQVKEAYKLISTVEGE